ncbi:hypothetical protein [Streptomyces sp. NPDC014623]|uniref:hypothetical protein n=1 Tax=Streptomyces sp. NPDC014623 TaxID=3364875 RepID=UPI0036FA7A1B
MSSIPFRFSAAAMADAGQLNRDVFEDILTVIETGLSRAPDNSVDPDEGRAQHLLWRRGLTKEKRHQLDAAEHRDEDDLDTKGPGNHAWQYIILYRPLNRGELNGYAQGYGNMILRIVGESEVATRYLLARDDDELVR